MAALHTTNFVVFLFFIIFGKSFEAKTTADFFREELFIKPLHSGHVYSYFQFTTIWNTSSSLNPYHHCHLFPRALGEIITTYNIQELHISLTAGLWRHEKWGYPVNDAPPGAEVWIWFKPQTKNVDRTWREVTSSLSGLLCASLNFLDASNSITPLLSFRPYGITHEPIDPDLLRYGTLPQEIVCTENLTPWKKLLPCDSKRGLATLLNAGNIHKTNYHSLGIHMRDICRNKTCLEASIELKQTVSLVYDLVILESGTPDFSMRKLFGSGLRNRCPLADQSKIYIDINKNSLELSPPPTSVLVSQRGGEKTDIAVYDLKEFQHMLNIAVVDKKKKIQAVSVKPPILWANRYISGYGSHRGGIVTKIFNKHWKPIHIIVLENIPWYVPVYLHTLKIQSKGEDIKPIARKYLPGRQRLNPSYLELLLQLPPRSVTEISIDFDFVFLKWQEYPPDASHGFYIGSSVITAILPLAKNYSGIPLDESFFGSSLNASREGYLVQLRTESMILTLPTPDFSMPYNVICLACTVVALAFGPIHNITTKQLRVSKTKKPQGLVSQAVCKLWNSLKKRKETIEKKEKKEN